MTISRNLVANSFIYTSQTIAKKTLTGFIPLIEVSRGGFLRGADWWNRAGGSRAVEWCECLATDDRFDKLSVGF